MGQSWHEMIVLADYKKSLGTLAESLTEKEILQRREQQDKEAELFWALWMEKLMAEDSIIKTNG